MTDPTGAGCGSFEAMRPHTVFCASPESARAYLARHGGLDAQILDRRPRLPDCG